MAKGPVSLAEIRQRDRGLYLNQRIEELQAEVQALREESRLVREALRSLTDRQTPEAKALRLRRAYTAERPDEANAELARLIAERKALRERSSG